MIHINIYSYVLYVYLCVCVCVCVWRARAHTHIVYMYIYTHDTHTYKLLCPRKALLIAICDKVAFHKLLRMLITNKLMRSMCVCVHTCVSDTHTHT
jgi:hypothetical protein